MKVVKKKTQKATPVVKKKSKHTAEIAELLSPKAQRKFEADAENALIDAEEEAEARYKWALKVKEQQDEPTAVALNRMVMKMAAMAGPPVFRFRNIALNVDEDRIKKIQYYTHLWIAVRLLAACAEWDIKIANYKPSQKRCAKCGKRVK